MHTTSDCMSKTIRSLFPSAIVLLLFFHFPLHTQPAPVLDAGRILLALEKLRVIGSVLYIAAHPDDENTAVLAYCANDRLLRTAYLSLTRGDGGQNLIGSEQAELLGVIRTQELLAARRLDGAEQFFTRAYDFGYSKNPEETFAFWEKEKILSDVVWVIRRFRPDVVMTRFPTTGEGGHGHHTASALLAEEAFHAASDPTKFPEQLQDVNVWRPKRLLWNAWIQIVQQRKQDTSRLLKLDVGRYNPLIGKSYSELAAESRSMHKSQGFGSSGLRGETISDFVLLAGDSTSTNVFGDDTFDWSRIQGGAVIQKAIEDAIDHFDMEEPEAILPRLVAIYKMMEALKEQYWIPIKKNELLTIIRSCAGLWIEALASDYYAAAGDSVRISATIVNRSSIAMKLVQIRFPFAEQDSVRNIFLRNGARHTLAGSFALPHTSITQPYWLEEKSLHGSFTVRDQQKVGMPQNGPPLVVGFTLEIEGAQLRFPSAVQYRWTDPVHGEMYRPFEIRPAVSLQPADHLVIFPNEESKSVRFTVLANRNGASGSVRIALPEDWHADPNEHSFQFTRKGDAIDFACTVTPPKKKSGGMLSLIADMGQEKIYRGLTTIDHAHIPKQTLFPLAETKLVRLEANRRSKTIGYIMGSGDEIPKYLEQLGYDVRILSEKDFENGSLASYDAIIAGVRAYNTREQLKRWHARLMEYVRNGGTYIVQYNTQRGFANRPPIVENIGPFPFKISGDRVTVEQAPVAFLLPEHPLLNTPNRITPDDFRDWIQERGLYFANEWDAQYETPISCNDPGESEKKGGMLYARYGKGIFIYTGYAFFRQIPAGVSGAIRLFVNMIEAGK